MSQNGNGRSVGSINGLKTDPGLERLANLFHKEIMEARECSPEEVIDFVEEVYQEQLARFGDAPLQDLVPSLAFRNTWKALHTEYGSAKNGAAKNYL